MSKISLTYPEAWMTISISIKNRSTGVTDFSGTMSEVVPRIYTYDFTEVAWVDYSYIASTTWYDDLLGVIYAESWGALTPTQEAQLANTVKKWDTILNLWDISIPL